MRALITRPAEDTKEIADALRARGFEVVIEPMLEIVPLDAQAPDLRDVQALLFTSVNGVRALTRLAPRRDLPVFAVGDATAAAARAAGFGSVNSAAGDSSDLARLVRARLKPEAGALLHVAGSAVAGDLAGALAGFEIRTLHRVPCLDLGALLGRQLRGDAGQRHRAEVLRVRDRELHARDAGCAKPSERVAGLGRHGCGDHRAHAVRGLVGDRREQLVLVLEVTIDGGRGHAGPGRDLAQREAIRTVLGDGAQARLDEGGPQVAVMIALLRNVYIVHFLA